MFKKLKARYRLFARQLNASVLSKVFSNLGLLSALLTAFALFASPLMFNASLPAAAIHGGNALTLILLAIAFFAKVSKEEIAKRDYLEPIAWLHVYPHETDDASDEAAEKLYVAYREVQTNYYRDERVSFHHLEEAQALAVWGGKAFKALKKQQAELKEMREHATNEIEIEEIQRLDQETTSLLSKLEEASGLMKEYNKRISAERRINAPLEERNQLSELTEEYPQQSADELLYLKKADQVLAKDPKAWLKK